MREIAATKWCAVMAESGVGASGSPSAGGGGSPTGGASTSSGIGSHDAASQGSTTADGIANSDTTADSLAGGAQAGSTVSDKGSSTATDANNDSSKDSKTTAESIAAQPTTAEALSGIGSLDNAVNHASATKDSIAEGLVNENTIDGRVDVSGLASSLDEAARASKNTYDGVRDAVNAVLPDAATRAALSTALDKYPAARDVPPGVAYTRDEIAKLEAGNMLPGISSHPNAHNYSEINRVTTRTDYQARRATVDALLRDPAPPSMSSSFNPLEDRDLNKRSPVKDGQFTDISSVGRVYHYVDEQSGSVVNITAQGHSLHPGYVSRGVYQGSDGTYVVSNGQGTGPMKDLNNIVGPVVWGESDSEIAQHLNEQGIK